MIPSVLPACRLSCLTPLSRRLSSLLALYCGQAISWAHWLIAVGHSACRWKESIHVSGEGEGSKATLVAWLKRRAEADFGHGVVGRNVWVCWCDPPGC